MSELTTILDVGWDTAHAANRSIDAMRFTGHSPEIRAAAAAEFTILIDMARPAMLMVGSPFDKNSPGFEDLREQEQTPTERQLTMPIGDLMDQVAATGLVTRTTHMRTLGACVREGVDTLGSVLAVGQLSFVEMHGCGDASVGYMQAIVAEVDPTLVWHESPEAVDVAQICPRLDMVPARIFDEALNSQSKIPDAQTLLSISTEMLSEILRRHFNYRLSSDGEIFEVASQVHARVRQFTQDFTNARAAM